MRLKTNGSEVLISPMGRFFTKAGHCVTVLNKRYDFVLRNEFHFSDVHGAMNAVGRVQSE